MTALERTDVKVLSDNSLVQQTEVEEPVLNETTLTFEIFSLVESSFLFHMVVHLKGKDDPRADFLAQHKGNGKERKMFLPESNKSFSISECFVSEMELDIPLLAFITLQEEQDLILLG